MGRTRMDRQLELSLPKRVGLLVAPDFRIATLSAVLDIVGCVNRLADKELYRVLVLSLDGKPVRAAEAVDVLPHHALGAEPPLGAAFVLGASNGSIDFAPEAIRWLRRQSNRAIPIAGVDAGTGLLAAAGLVDGVRCTRSTVHQAELEARFSRVVWSDSAFEVERNRLSARTEAGTMELMLELIGRDEGPTFSRRVAGRLERAGVRGSPDRRRMQERARLADCSPPTGSAIGIMEANLERPLSCAEIARRVGLSMRQLERLFQEHCRRSPRAFYAGLRLAHARRLLEETVMTLDEVARAVGFARSAYFIRRYRAHFGERPRVERRAET